jgi:hypothetical protein
MRTPRGQQAETAVARLPRFKITPKACGFQLGVEVLRLNQLNDELETEELQRKLTMAESRHRPARP